MEAPGSSAGPIQHLVVLMLEGRSFDHMLGFMKSPDYPIEGLDGTESNVDADGRVIAVSDDADHASTIIPACEFRDVEAQISGGKMSGFVNRNGPEVMKCFSPQRIPVLTTLARQYAVCDHWFSSVPGPSSPNRMFADLATSMGIVGNAAISNVPAKPVVDVLLESGHTAKVYFAATTMANNPGQQIFSTFDQFLDDCKSGSLPGYALIEPRHFFDPTVNLPANDQQPGTDVADGEQLILSVYTAIRSNPDLWKSTLLLIVYSTHGGFYDHVSPPRAVAPDGMVGMEPAFDFTHLGVRVPAVIVSPWIAPGTIDHTRYDHSSIVATARKLFLGDNWQSSFLTQRDKFANTFDNVLTLLAPRTDRTEFDGLGTPTTPVVPQAGFASDDPDGVDLLNITPEVEALCSVIAAKDTDLPLSLGLFGDWGTGKSFFMHKMERRIDELQKDARAAEGDSAYCSEIVQLTFNAWHYIDTNLWASLTAEIFEGLAAALATKPNTDFEYERTRVLAAAASSRDVLAEAERKKAAAETELAASEQRLKQLQTDQAQIENGLTPQELLRSAANFAIQQPEVQTQIDLAVKALKLPQVEAAASDVKRELLELSGIVSAIALTMRKTKYIWVWLAAAALAIFLSALGVQFLLPKLRDWGVPDVMRQLTAVLIFTSGLITPFLPAARKALKFVQAARAEKERLMNQERSKQEKALLAEQAHVQLKVDGARKEVDDASALVVKLDKQLEELRADRQMADFIKQRHESTDYTQHLGIIARARNDFKHLTALMGNVRKEAEKELVERRRKIDEDRKKENKGPLLPRIDRIILYIDDLDRCPEDKVVDVLQAVHMLLAFPLFVVVVGVDARWLLHSLEQHSPAFQAEKKEAANLPDEERTHWQSTPLNYLEKIFQIPFTLRPMEDTGFGDLIDDLAKPGKDTQGKTLNQEPKPTESVSANSENQTGIDAPIEIPEDAISGRQEVVFTKSAKRIDRHPDHLVIEPWEREAMKQLYRLIPSPRAGKRFVNVYRLIRASIEPGELDSFKGDATAGEHRTVLLLLAILTGYPSEATEILRALMTEQKKMTWWKFFDTFPRPGDNGVPAGAEMERWKELQDKVSDARHLIPENQSCASFIKWAPGVARYSFHSGRVLQARSTDRNARATGRA